MNLERALKHANHFDHLMTPVRGLFNYSNSRMRIAKHYTPIHTLLEFISGGSLAGKRLLHLAASTGTYVKFLQDQLHMQAVALDIDRDSLKESAARGVKRNVRAQGVFHTVSTGRFVVPPGRIIAVPEEIHVRLPFADKSFQFVVSDHFLFSDYHTNDGKADGIEYQQGSIQRSEETLPELNRILKRGGCVLVGETHGDHTPDLQRYQRNFATKGFVVAAAYDDFLRPVKKGNYPRFFVLRKVHDVRPMKNK